jgi:hypothetical protein
MNLPSFLHRQALRDRAVALRTHLKNFWAHVKGGTWLKSPFFWAKFLGYSIPLGIFLYILYLNYLPFGYHKTFTIDVGSEGDTTVSEFYLEPSPDLSERKTAPDGTTYRELNGTATVVFRPKAVLKGAEVTVEVEGEGVTVIPPSIDFDPNSVTWDYDWDFTKGTPANLKNDGVFAFDGMSYFDGASRVEMPDSSNRFDDGPFTVYAEWTPANPGTDFQQIVGHYNWELLQDKNAVRFFIGRTNGGEGPFYSSEYKITDPEAFFGKKHVAIATYAPDPTGGFGYIELFIDGHLAQRTQVGSDLLWTNYGNEGLSFGKSAHGTASFFKGGITRVSLTGRISNPSKDDAKSLRFSNLDAETAILVRAADGRLSTVTLHANSR